MRYHLLLYGLLALNLLLLAANVWAGLTYGSALNWAVCVFIGGLVIYQLVVIARLPR